MFAYKQNDHVHRYLETHRPLFMCPLAPFCYLQSISSLENTQYVVIIVQRKVKKTLYEKENQIPPPFTFYTGLTTLCMACPLSLAIS